MPEAGPGTVGSMNVSAVQAPARGTSRRLAAGVLGAVLWCGFAAEHIAWFARTGRPVWKFQTGGSIVAAPVTYSFRGRQYLTVAAADSIITFALPE